MTQDIAARAVPGSGAAGAAASSASPTQAAAFTNQLQAQMLMQGLAQADQSGASGSAQDDSSLAALLGQSAPGAASQFGGTGLPTISAQQMLQLQGMSGGTGGLGVQSLLAGMTPGGIGAMQGTGAASRLTGDTDGLKPELRAGLEQVAAALGKDIDIVSGYRTRDEQAALYQKYLNGTGNLAAPPGHSNHESGNAADAYIGGVPLASVPGAAEAAKAAGLHFPVGGEAWHVEHV